MKQILTILLILSSVYADEIIYNTFNLSEENRCNIHEAFQSNENWPYSTCLVDCDGQWDGYAIIDDCGECGGDNSSCDITGDLNGDLIINILDVIIMVNIILDDEPYNLVADLNDDSVNNIFDVIILINWIINDNYNDEDSKLQGTWVGDELDSPDVIMTLEFSANQIVGSGVVDNDVLESYEGTFTTNTSVTPNELDIFIEYADIYGYGQVPLNSLSLCIYEISGDTLLLAGSVPGSDIRPTTFTLDEDNGELVRVFTLIKQ